MGRRMICDLVTGVANRFHQVRELCRALSNDEESRFRPEIA